LCSRNAEYIPRVYSSRRDSRHWSCLSNEDVICSLNFVLTMPIATDCCSASSFSIFFFKLDTHGLYPIRKCIKHIYSLETSLDDCWHPQSQCDTSQFPFLPDHHHSLVRFIFLVHASASHICSDKRHPSSET
jgi:hypothetical protein